MSYTNINKSTDYFNTKLYTGNGSAGHAITGVGFQPDWVWIKNRDSATEHSIFDAVRGATYRLASNNTDAQSAQAAELTAFGSDGFTTGNAGGTNGSGNGIVAWNWKANGQGSSNTDGSINTTYTSANTTAGFSISQYTGTSSAATIGHGLGAKPAMIIAKRLTGSAEAWVVYHQSLGGGTTPQDKYLHLNTTDAEGDSAAMWNDTAPTSSVFSVGTSTSTNQAGGTFVAYCFAGKQGFSKFGSYTGNGNASDPPFIYTGFKPNFVMVKKYNGTQSWVMTDLVRDNAVGGGGNGIGARLQAQSSAAEDSNDTWAAINKFSNGFQPIYNDDVTNGSGSTYMFMAFAAAPLVGSNDIPANAR